jgi:peptide-methionine (S)-S-oxide reductase
MFFGDPKKLRLPSAAEALPGRSAKMPVPERHHVLAAPLDDAFTGKCKITFGLGCFWGAERKYWQTPGVVSTAVGYAGGHTANPTYEEVCSGRTGHTEVVRVVFDPAVTTLEKLLEIFWESHDPTQGMRQGNDVGTQYRSAIYAYDDADLERARQTRDVYQRALAASGYGEITTEIDRAGVFYFAEDYHQQYLAKNPGGYCGIGGTGVRCPTGAGVVAR